jgi:hypothetical protein
MVVGIPQKPLEINAVRLSNHPLHAATHSANLLYLAGHRPRQIQGQGL